MVPAFFWWDKQLGLISKKNRPNFIVIADSVVFEGVGNLSLRSIMDIKGLMTD